MATFITNNKTYFIVVSTNAHLTAFEILATVKSESFLFST